MGDNLNKVFVDLAFSGHGILDWMFGHFDKNKTKFVLTTIFGGYEDAVKDIHLRKCIEKQFKAEILIPDAVRDWEASLRELLVKHGMNEFVADDDWIRYVDFEKILSDHSCKVWYINAGNGKLTTSVRYYAHGKFDELSVADEENSSRLKKLQQNEPKIDVQEIDPLKEGTSQREEKTNQREKVQKEWHSMTEQANVQEIDHLRQEIERLNRRLEEETNGRDKVEKELISVTEQAKIKAQENAQEIDRLHREIDQHKEEARRSKEETTRIKKIEKQLTNQEKINAQEIVRLSREINQQKEDAIGREEEIIKHGKIEKKLLLVDLEASKKLVHELQLKCAELELHQWSCMEFTYSELKEATNNFDESLKIGAGGFSTVFKGFLRHTHVAIKILKKQGNQHDMRGFNQEVETLRKVRHPNLVTLIGACRNKESPALVFEFLTNGSLEDHLNRENGSPPLSGEARIRIALEICSTLSFLHSASTAHGDLKPGNILLDSNYGSKLGDFGTARQLVYDKNTITPYHLTGNVTGTIAYMDLDHLSGRLTPQSDVYSFGVVLLQLATGKDAIVETRNSRTMLSELVETAIEKDTFDKLIDVEWPSKEAPRKMAELGLCCIEKKRNRPNTAKLYKSLMDIANAI